MELETIRELVGYGYFFMTVLLALALYGYVYHMYKSEKTGRKSYEKYANIALNDEIDDEPVESFSKHAKSANYKEEQK